MPSNQIIDLDWDSIGDEIGGAGLRDLMHDIHRGYQARAVVSGLNQALAAKQFKNAGIGPDGMRVDMTVDAMNFHYWSIREGLECWSDDQFCEETKRDTPGTAVHARSNRTVFTSAGFKGGAR